MGPDLFTIFQTKLGPHAKKVESIFFSAMVAPQNHSLAKNGCDCSALNIIEMYDRVKLDRGDIDDHVNPAKRPVLQIVQVTHVQSSTLDSFLIPSVTKCPPLGFSKNLWDISNTGIFYLYRVLFGWQNTLV